MFPFALKWFMCGTKESLLNRPIWSLSSKCSHEIESSWNVMAHGDAQEGKWKGNWWMEWVTSTLHTTPEHVPSITTADAHTSAASSRLNWRPRRFKWNRPFRRKTKSGFCACAITFQTQSNSCELYLRGHVIRSRPRTRSCDRRSCVVLLTVYPFLFARIVVHLDNTTWRLEMVNDGIWAFRLGA
jgi:hypothetical protein